MIGILFDMDGTLVDTEGAAIRAILDCYQDWGIDLPLAQATAISGVKWEYAAAKLFKDFPPPEGVLQPLEKIMERYRHLLQLETPEVPGARDFVKKCREEGLRLALVSGSHCFDIERALEKLGIKECFEVVLGAENYKESKPSPDGYLSALARMQLQPEQVVVFEDSNAGIQSAKAAGCKVIAVTSTEHVGVDFGAANAHIRDFKALEPRSLRALLGFLV